MRLRQSLSVPGQSAGPVQGGIPVPPAPPGPSVPPCPPLPAVPPPPCPGADVSLHPAEPLVPATSASSSNEAIVAADFFHDVLFKRSVGKKKPRWPVRSGRKEGTPQGSPRAPRTHRYLVESTGWLR